MTQLQNHTRAGGFLQSEANGFLSRDKVTLEGGTGGAGKVYAGTILGIVSANGKYLPWNPGAGDGSQTAKAILFDDVDATAGDLLVAVISRDAEVRQADLLYYPSTANPPVSQANGTQIGNANTSLAGVNIIVRS